MYVAGAHRNLDHLDKPLRVAATVRCHKIFRLAPPGCIPTVALTGLLIFDPETVHFTPRPFASEPCAPILDLLGDMSPRLWGQAVCKRTSCRRSSELASAIDHWPSWRFGFTDLEPADGG